MHRFVERLRKTITAVGPWLATIGIIGATELIHGATPEEWKTRRLAIDRQFDDLAQLPAATSVPGQQVRPIRRDPGRQYFFVPPEMLPSPSPTSKASADPPPPPRADTSRHAEYAEQLFQLASEALEDGQSDVAYRWVHEVLRFDPRHARARRIVGLPSSPQATELTFRPGRKPHPRFGWRRASTGS